MISKFNALHGYYLAESPTDGNKQSQQVHFKYQTPSTKTSPVVSDITGRLKHHTVYNGDIEVYLSDYHLEYPSGSFTDLDNSPIKSIDDDEIDRILGLFHLEHDYDILYFDIHMIQASLVVASHLNIYEIKP